MPKPQQLLEFMKLDFIPRNNRLMFCCPFHHDTDPSAGFYEDTQLAHCFSCGYTYDVFKFYAMYQGIPYQQAKDDLEKRFGEAPPKQMDKTRQVRLAVARARGEEVLREAKPKLDMVEHAKLGEIFDQLLLLHNRGAREECALDTDLEMWYNSVKESVTRDRQTHAETCL